MKIKHLLSAFAMVLVVIMTASAQEEMTLEQILQNYYQNTGVENLKQVQTMIQYGHFDLMGNTMSRITYLKRPNKMRNEMEMRGTKIITAFDGQKGWMINPFSGSSDPQPMDSITIANLQDQLSFEGLLYDYKDKGYTATYEGTEDVEGTEAYVIHLQKKDKDVWYYLDTETFIPIKQRASATINGRKIEQETYFSNYQQIEGIAFPFLTIVKSNSNGPTSQIQMVTDSIKLNVPLADSLFTLQPKETETQEQ